MAEPARTIDWAVSGLAQLFDTVLTAAAGFSDLTDAERDQFAETGAVAFAAGMSLSVLIDTYLGGAGEVWEHVFTDADPSRTVELGRSLRRVSGQAVSALAEGFESAQRLSIRAEESQRRAFLDELLSTDADRSRLADVALKLDFPRFEQAIVAVAGAARSFTDGGPVHRRIRTELESRAPQRQLRVTTKDSRIVIIALDTAPTDLSKLLTQVFGTVSDIDWQIGVGETVDTLDAIGASFAHASEALRIGAAFGLDPPTEFDRILPQRLLSADPEITEALIRTAIDPLVNKPGGDLLATLASFIRHGGNMAEVARHLDIAARTVAYRLDRIAELTGYSARRPEERFVLELAIRALPMVGGAGTTTRER